MSYATIGSDSDAVNGTREAFPDVCDAVALLLREDGSILPFLVKVLAVGQAAKHVAFAQSRKAPPSLSAGGRSMWEMSCGHKSWATQAFVRAMGTEAKK